MRIENIVKLRYWEKLLLAITFFSILFPLQTKVSVLSIVFFNLPLYALIFIGAIHRVESGNHFIGKFDKWILSAYIMLFFLFFSSLWSPGFSDTFGQFLQFAHLPFLAIYFRSIFARKLNANTLIIFAVLVLSLESFTSIIQQLTNSDFGNIKAYIGEDEKKSQIMDLEAALSRIQGTLGNPNVVGAWIITCIPFIIIMRFYSRFSTLKWWIFRLTLFVMSTITIFFTFSRGALGIFLLLCVIAFPFYLKMKRNISVEHFRYENFLRFSVYISFVLIGLVIFIKNLDLVGIAIDYAEIRIKDTFTSSNRKVSADYRLVMNEAAIKYIWQNPLVGIGFGNGNLIYSQVGFYSSNLLFRPHNTYLLMGVEGGILAMLCFMYFTLTPVFRLIKRKITNPIQFALSFSLIACLGFVQIYLITVSSDFAPLFFILLGVAMGFTDENFKKSQS